MSSATRSGGPSARRSISRHGRFINKANFDKTHAFFERYGAKALVLGRFVPIVRTFITVVAGVGKMDRRHFFVWSGVGRRLLGHGITLAGYFLGQAFPVSERSPRGGDPAHRGGLGGPDGAGSCSSTAARHAPSAPRRRLSPSPHRQPRPSFVERPVQPRREAGSLRLGPTLCVG
jgi:hypothetical protein